MLVKMIIPSDTKKIKVYLLRRFMVFILLPVICLMIPKENIML